MNDIEIIVAKKKCKEFLTELSALTKKYGIRIDGCGCCGSPWLEDDHRQYGECLDWDNEAQAYTIYPNF